MLTVVSTLMPRDLLLLNLLVDSELYCKDLSSVFNWNGSAAVDNDVDGVTP